MIINKTTNKKFNIDISDSNTFFKRFKGLMLKKDFYDAMVFSGMLDSSIHTLFMRFEIDVYFLDENKVVFDKVTLKKWKSYKPKKQAHYIIETKKGMLNLKINDEIEFF